MGLQDTFARSVIKGTIKTNVVKKCARIVCLARVKISLALGPATYVITGDIQSIIRAMFAMFAAWACSRINVHKVIV